MKRSVIETVLSVRHITESVSLLKIPFFQRPLPGQFVMVSFTDAAGGPYLPRPISVFDWEDGVLSLLIKKVGRGTAMLADSAGRTVRVTGPLGTAFPDSSGHLLCVGGGIGSAPLLYALRNSDAERRTAVLGFQGKNTAAVAELFWGCADVTVTTDDGSVGQRGTPIDVCRDLMKSDSRPDMVFTCGPEVMMRVVDGVMRPDVPIWFSFEARMACGFGACLGCRITGPGGSYLVCREGPVFSGTEIYGRK